ncbi:MAG: hypothetical protein IJR90_07040 [Clostridia bacterium]|nr:hypothetical protein [Clostridia bacterium]
MKNVILREFSYSPGYSDMRGAYHEQTLKKDESGRWVIICSDREYYNAPTVVKTYLAAEDGMEGFEALVKSRKVLSLSRRAKSRMFLTDYSPEEYYILLEKDPDGKGDLKDYRITQYKRFFKRDFRSLELLRETFEALKGQKISEEEISGGD